MDNLPTMDALFAPYLCIVHTFLPPKKGQPLNNGQMLAPNVSIIRRIHWVHNVCVLQLGTLGAGNHYAEIQVVDEIYDDLAAYRMGVEHKGQVYITEVLQSLTDQIAESILESILGFIAMYQLHHGAM